MPLEEPSKFNVIEVEWSPEFKRQYFLGWESKGGFYTNNQTYTTLHEVARDIAIGIVGTDCHYEIRSEPQPEGGRSYFKDNEGLSGNSESTRFIHLVRKLESAEMSELGRILMFEIAERKKVLNSSDN
jgi:hypothetical protein